MRQLILPLSIVAATSCNLVPQSKPHPVVVTAPESTPSNFHTNDSSFLKMKIKDDKFVIDFLNKVSVIDNVYKLDTFFQKNITRIHKEKVVITNFDTSNKNKNLNNLLAKYGIVKFRVNRG